jgi:hypothetical protein
MWGKRDNHYTTETTKQKIHSPDKELLQMSKKAAEAEHGAACLWSQHLEDWGKRTAWT